jgi:DNA invertase Pin-like site-specific DNA recombinase
MEQREAAFSGASLDRPALQQLLAEVRAGKIDIVLVYKVDRLTRACPRSQTSSSGSRSK